MSNITATGSVNSALDYFGDGSTRVPSKGLNQDDFLRLLVTQMTSQDPLNPKADLDMAAQMAQFTSLEQSRGMAANLTSLLGQQQILQASNLIGRAVEVRVDSTTTLTGLVDQVNLVDGQPRLMIQGEPWSLDAIVRISPAPAAPLTDNSSAS